MQFGNYQHQRGGAAGTHLVTQYFINQKTKEPPLALDSKPAGGSGSLPRSGWGRRAGRRAATARHLGQPPGCPKAQQCEANRLGILDIRPQVIDAGGQLVELAHYRLPVLLPGLVKAVHKRDDRLQLHLDPHQLEIVDPQQEASVGRAPCCQAKQQLQRARDCDLFNPAWRGGGSGGGLQRGAAVVGGGSGVRGRGSTQPRLGGAASRQPLPCAKAQLKARGCRGCLLAANPTLPAAAVAAAAAAAAADAAAAVASCLRPAAVPCQQPAQSSWHCTAGNISSSCCCTSFVHCSSCIAGAACLPRCLPTLRRQAGCCLCSAVCRPCCRACHCWQGVCPTCR